jgi:hypothetical protein
MKIWRNTEARDSVLTGHANNTEVPLSYASTRRLNLQASSCTETMCGVVSLNHRLRVEGLEFDIRPIYSGNNSHHLKPFTSAVRMRVLCSYRGCWRLISSGMLRRVAGLVSDFSDDHGATATLFGHEGTAIPWNSRNCTSNDALSRPRRLN